MGEEQSGRLLPGVLSARAGAARPAGAAVGAALGSAAGVAGAAGAAGAWEMHLAAWLLEPLLERSRLEDFCSLVEAELRAAG